MKSVRFHTLGCKVNQYETEAMKEIFESRGYEVLEDGDADIYVINTCTVTNIGDRKSRQFMRRAKKSNKNAIVAAVGCYTQISPEEVEKIEEVDVIVGTTSRHMIVDLCEEALSSKGKINVVEDIRNFDEFEDLSIDTVESKTRAYIKIQDGCNQYCSYCIIPYARGPIRSRPLESIVKESLRLSKAGFKEVILTGIHVASYGKDLGSLSLIDVIEEVAKVEGIERIRLSSIEPTLIDDNFMERGLKTGKLCHHFHLSLQSGSNGVLKRMNRKYSVEEYFDIVTTIRKYMPDAGLTTDVIVGFPGETDEEFQETMDFVKKVGFSKVHVFKYSPREGTPAAKRDDQVDGNIKNERSHRLIDLSDKLANGFNSRFIGKNMEVLFESQSDGVVEGYTSNYIKVETDCENLEGKIKSIKIIGRKDDILVGNITI